MTTAVPYKITLSEPGRRTQYPDTAQELILMAIVERLEALVNSVDKLREALISKETP